MKSLTLCNFQSPGDIMTLTAAIKSLHDTYPGMYATNVHTCAPEIWENNPHITKTPGASERIVMEYPSIHKSNQRARGFIEAFTEFLGEKLGVPLSTTTNRPHLYLSNDEKSWVNQIAQHFTGGKKIPYWIINAGYKNDFTIKLWPYYQQIIDMTQGMVQWVQIGSREHKHTALKGVIDLIGKTSHRQLHRLVHHAVAAIGPVTYLQHICAALEKPYICLAGGREPAQWITYPKQITLHTIGVLRCCKDAACWKSRVVKLNDAQPADLSLCEWPVMGAVNVAKCMAIITPKDVLPHIERICISQ